MIAWTTFVWLGRGTVVGFCDNGDQH